MQIKVLNNIEDLFLIKKDWDALFIKGDYKSFKASIIKVINNSTDYLPNQNIDSYSKDKVVETYNHIINSLKEK